MLRHLAETENLGPMLNILKSDSSEMFKYLLISRLFQWSEVFLFLWAICCPRTWQLCPSPTHTHTHTLWIWLHRSMLLIAIVDTSNPYFFCPPYPIFFLVWCQKRLFFTWSKINHFFYYLGFSIENLLCKCQNSFCKPRCGLSISKFAFQQQNTKLALASLFFTTNLSFIRIYNFSFPRISGPCGHWTVSFISSNLRFLHITYNAASLIKLQFQSSTF